MEKRCLEKAEKNVKNNLMIFFNSKEVNKFFIIFIISLII
jgi:hypothetical protein